MKAVGAAADARARPADAVCTVTGAAAAHVSTAATTGPATADSLTTLRVSMICTVLTIVSLADSSTLS
jgi:hypothetical protein